ncbi:hypothetical protein TGME49_204150 [Toxoplasma gondii ME49]|uniref:Uncharacterized protein n=3 Tax=Toxoplasma gondii TaxID=5811 RepID=A0A2G8XWY3_TOXGO|nr:hypothetical protein TGME49_204150 [Toxoplasma gondii ME49]EPT30051.1 hypothetical protein TGME49_204150 [Toxoplasma gondii ME49]KYF44349.1 hypothetical protein TGARI_204150 [Toxoplasma gondii ARI]PIL99544.1 hypothetical protein TGCOUG_204150 [Toxoplasma gondii COUG]|eukprot:XP_018637317.1 hypothetical protein TGME49_204150 [Toxoplasma gondii ME49]
MSSSKDKSSKCVFLDSAFLSGRICARRAAGRSGWSFPTSSSISAHAVFQEGVGLSVRRGRRCCCVHPPFAKNFLSAATLALSSVSLSDQQLSQTTCDASECTDTDAAPRAARAVSRLFLYFKSVTPTRQTRFRAGAFVRLSSPRLSRASWPRFSSLSPAFPSPALRPFVLHCRASALCREPRACRLAARLLAQGLNAAAS